jgi:hypothetical protein
MKRRAELIFRLRCASLKMTGFFDMVLLRQVAGVFRGLIPRTCGLQVLRTASARDDGF